METKYIHILWMNDLKFNGRIIEMINKDGNGINALEHLFVTTHIEVYNEFGQYDNVVLDDAKCNLLNKYYNQCQWIISHSIKSKKCFLTARKRALKKTLFRYWGGGIAGFRKNDNILKDSLVNIVNAIYRYKINEVAAIGIANTVDTLDIRKTIQKPPLVEMPYVNIDDCNALDSIQQKREDSSCINILVGHRARREDNHIAILEGIKNNTNDLKLYVPVSYGDANYIKELEAYVEDNAMKNVVLMKEFMPFEEYVSFLNEIDVGIFDELESCALGSIAILLRLGKMVCLNRSGVIAEGFRHENVPFGYTDEVANLNRDIIERTQNKVRTISSNLVFMDYEYYVQKWKEILEIYN